jgi:hypothetical protein
VTSVIQVLGTAGGGWSPTRPTWVQTYDPDGNDGFGRVKLTTQLANALTFESPGEAFHFWRRQSTVRPLRDDGKPNRPLTAYTVEIGPL